MTVTWQQISTALLLALVLHGAIAVWLVLPAPEQPPIPSEQPLRVSLLAAIAETTTTPAPVTPPPQKKIKPPVTPQPKPKPKPVLEPMVQTPTPKPQPVIKPIPKPDPLPIEVPPEIVEAPAPIQEIVPPDPVATAKYEHLLIAWLEKHKKYPRRAKRMRIEGEALLRILIDRTGQTKKVTLEQHTGNRLLDKAVLEMAERANPFPPIPENDLRQTLEFIVPVVFALR